MPCEMTSADQLRQYNYTPTLLSGTAARLARGSARRPTLCWNPA